MEERDWTWEEQREHRFEWSEALRSGDYQQITQRLRVLENDMGLGGGYCCLGVACDISGMHQWSLDDGVANYGRTQDGYDRCSVDMPPEVQDYFGIQDGIGSFLVSMGLNNEGTSLATMNDNGMTFEDIAATILDEPTNMTYESLDITTTQVRERRAELSQH